MRKMKGLPTMCRQVMKSDAEDGPRMDRRTFCKSCLAAMLGVSGATAWLSGCSRGKSSAPGASVAGGIPGVTRRSGNVFLFENHNVAHLIWHALGVRHGTLVHVDTHDDFRHVDSGKLAAARRLLDRGDFDALFRRTDMSSSFEFKVRAADLLFDLGNFLFPCMADGTISHLYWVLPDKSISPECGLRLARHFQQVLKLPSLPSFGYPREGIMELDFGDKRLTVSTLDALPSFPRGTLLDFDVDFFAFPYALADEHLPGALIWDPARVCRALRERVPVPAVTTICSSVWGGYLPLWFRFLADACFDFMVSGRYPAYAETLMEETVGIRTMTRPGREPSPPTDPTYRPAWSFLGGMLQLSRGQRAEGLNRIEEAAKNRPVYQKGLQDASEALLYMGQPDGAEDALSRLERMAGCTTTGSMAWRVRVLLAKGDPKGAEVLSKTLIDWEDQPFFLMLHGGVLTEQRRFDEAAKIYAEVIRQAPNNGGAYYNMGVVLDRQEKLQEAVDYYRKALSLKPLFADAHENLAYVLLRQGRLDDAIAHFEETVRISPLRVKAWGNLGVAHSARGDHDKALFCCRRALEINPNMAELHFNMAKELAAVGKPNDAAQEYREALRLRPDWKEAAERLRALPQK